MARIGCPDVIMSAVFVLMAVILPLSIRARRWRFTASGDHYRAVKFIWLNAAVQSWFTKKF